MTKAPKPARRHLTVSQRSEIAALYRTGEFTISGLAEKFGRSEVTIVKVLKQAKAVKGEAKLETERKLAEKFAAKMEEAVLDEASVLANRIKETRDETYKMSSAIAKLMFSSVIEAKKAGLAVAALNNDLKALMRASQIVESTLKCRFTSLGVKENDDNAERPLPALVIQELTAQQIEDMKKISVEVEKEIIDDTAIDDDLDLDDIS